MIWYIIYTMKRFFANTHALKRALDSHKTISWNLFDFFPLKKLELEKVILSDFVLLEQNARARNAAERGLRKIDCNRRVRSTSGEAALPPPQGDFLEYKKFTNNHSQGMSKAKVRGMPQSEVSGKSTATAECEARAARRLSRRRREIFWL